MLDVILRLMFAFGLLAACFAVDWRFGLLVMLDTAIIGALLSAGHALAKWRRARAEAA